MAYPLTVPQASHTTSPTRVIAPTVAVRIPVGSPPTRHWKPLVPSSQPGGARSVRTRIVVPTVPQPIRVGLPPNRVWAQLLPLEEFTFPTEGQWLPRAARDRP